jgi:hypothetical protein
LMTGSRDKRFGFKLHRASIYGMGGVMPRAEDGTIVPYYSPWNLWGTPLPFFRGLYLLFDSDAKIEIPLTDDVSRTFLPLDGRRLNFRICMTFLVGFILGAVTVAAAMHTA